MRFLYNLTLSIKRIKDQTIRVDADRRPDKIVHLPDIQQQRHWAKYVACLCVVLHQTLAVFTMRYSQTTREAAGRPRYLSTSTVVAAEVMKLVGSFLLVVLEEGGLIRGTRVSASKLVESPSDMLKLMVPGLLYAVQNNFLFIALANLTAAVYTGTYQIKTLTTTLFSVWLLGKQLTRSQWLALIVLAVGVALLQWPSADAKTSGNTTTWSSQVAVGSPIVGLAAVLGASVTSGFCGVFMEKILKQKGSSLWMKNLQLASVGIPMSLVGAFWCDSAKIREEGFFQGYDTLVWSVVCINALGGLAIAAVLRYADNIVKCFATAAAVLVSCALSAAMGELVLSTAFCVGACLVIAASISYSVGPSSGAILFSVFGRCKHVLEAFLFVIVVLFFVHSASPVDAAYDVQHLQLVRKEEGSD